MIYTMSFYLGKLFSNRVTQYISNKVELLVQVIYSGWISNQLLRVGNCFFVGYPSYFSGLDHIKIGNRFSARKRFRLEAVTVYNGIKYDPQLIIGDNVRFEEDCHVACVNSITIEDDVLIAGKVFITDHFHGSITRESLQFSPTKRPLYSRGPIVIKRNAWIGEGVAILPNVVIGENCIVGANAVVTKSFPNNSIIAGNPARCIKVLQDT